MTTYENGSSATGERLSASELRGRSVWTESGDRLGTLRGATTDDAGNIVSLDVQQRWILGPHRSVPATGMRLDGNDVIVPSDVTSSKHHDNDTRTRSHSGGTHVRSHDRSSTTTSDATVLGGRDAARKRFGGGDVLASLGGALAALSTALIVGSLLASLFATDGLSVDTSITNWRDLLTEPWIMGAAALTIASLVGGWVAGRSARYDGGRNGMLAVVWLLVMGAASVLAGAWFGDRYDVANVVDLPTFRNTDELATAGIIGGLIVLALMLLAGALGGRIGSMWHRRADRAMFDTVPVREHDRDTVRDTRVTDRHGVNSDTVVRDRDRSQIDDDAVTSRRDDSPMSGRGLRGTTTRTDDDGSHLR